ncbi:MAG: putative integron cassette protein [Ramlibacter sp.]|nr:putative integron cassette protein [Ramlibacter sp.]
MAVLLLTGCGGGSGEPVVAYQIAVEQLHPAIAARYSFGGAPSCSAPVQCRSTVSIDCGSATDGPKDYYDNPTGKLLMRCGGACMLPRMPGEGADPLTCSQCPPKEWTC